MTSELEAAAKAYKRAATAHDRRRSELAAAIVRADSEGVAQVDIVRITGYTRERVRQIVREAERRGRTGDTTTPDNHDG